MNKNRLMTLLSLFGGSDTREYKYVIVKRIFGGQLYFRAYLDGLPDFTSDRQRAWRFETPGDAERATRAMGAVYRDARVIEVETTTTPGTPAP